MREPTNLIALWEGREAPRVEDVREGLAAPASLAVVPAEGDDVLWSLTLREPLERPIVIWAESARDVLPEDLDDDRARACRWAIGVEQMLDAADPLTSWLDLLRCLLRAAPGAPAMLDVNTTAWYGSEVLRGFASPAAIEPPAEVLWTIHAVDASAGPSAWLHTHGLWRCGRCELEMLEVPPDRAGEAARLMNDLGELLLEDEEPPQTGEPIEIGPGLRVTLQPWPEVAARLPESVPGSMRDRRGECEEAHTGERLVICGQRRRGGASGAWTWPQEVMNALANDQSMVYRTARASARQAAVARATWKLFLCACGERLGEEGVVKVQFNDARGGDHHEHLWFDTVAAEGDLVRGRLINDPLVAGLKRGATYDLDPARVSDWRVSIGEVDYAPDDWRALSEVLGRDVFVGGEGP